MNFFILKGDIYFKNEYKENFIINENLTKINKVFKDILISDLSSNSLNFPFNILIKNQKDYLINLKTKKIINNKHEYFLILNRFSKKFNKKNIEKYLELDNFNKFNSIFLYFKNKNKIFIFKNKKDYYFFKNFIFKIIENSYILEIKKNNLRINDIYLKHFVFIEDPYSDNNVLFDENYIFNTKRFKNILYLFSGNYFVYLKNEKKIKNIKKYNKNIIFIDNLIKNEFQINEDILIDNIVSYLIFLHLDYLKNNEIEIEKKFHNKLLLNYINLLLENNSKINLIKEYKKFKNFCKIFYIKNNLSFLIFKSKYKLLKEKKFLSNINKTLSYQ